MTVQQPSTTDALLINLDKLGKDLRKAASTVTDREARYLVKLYYTMQDQRIRAAGQVRSMNTGEPHATIDWFHTQSETLEKSLKGALGEYAKSRVVGLWSQSILGIGPVISAGLMAHIKLIVWTCYAPDKEKKKRTKKEDQCTKDNACSKLCQEERVNVASRIWRYAGLDPTMVWGKGEKRPWNAALKVLCWKIGQSFVMQKSRDNDVYGHLMALRKEREVAKNEKNEYSSQAERILSIKNIGKSTEAYKWYSQGKLPPAHIQQRAERWAVKLFLAHWLEVAYREAFNERPPNPYVMDILGHKDMIQVPNYPWND